MGGVWGGTLGPEVDGSLLRSRRGMCTSQEAPEEFDDAVERIGLLVGVDPNPPIEPSALAQDLDLAGERTVVEP